MRLIPSGVPCVLLAVLVIGSGVAPAQVGEPLRYRWREGDVARYVTGQEVTWEVKGAGDELLGAGGGSQTNHWSILYGVTREVGLVDQRGVATVTQTYDWGSVKADASGEKVEYDSRVPGAADDERKEHRLIKPFAAFIGKTIEFDVDAEGKVYAVRGAKEILDEATSAVGEGNPLVKALAGGAGPSEESIRQELERQLRVIPGKRVRPRESWEVAGSQKMPLVGVLKTSVTHTLKRFGRKGRQAVAEIESAGKIEQGDGGMGALGVMKLSESDVEGETEFLVDDGRIETSRYRVKMVFEMGMGKQSLGTFELTQSGSMEPR
jgi:hypothetical protein